MQEGLHLTSYAPSYINKWTGYVLGDLISMVKFSYKMRVSEGNLTKKISSTDFIKMFIASYTKASVKIQMF